MRKQLELQTIHGLRVMTNPVQGCVAAGVALVLLGLAGTAQAGDEFEAGFEYELGRVTAHHIAAVSHLLIFGFHPHQVAVYRHRDEQRYRPHGYHHRSHYRSPHRRHVRHQMRHERRQHGEYARGHERSRDRHRDTDRRGSRRRDARSHS